MAELKEMQEFFQSDCWKRLREASRVVCNCEEMRRHKGNRKAVTAFLRIAEYFYGKEQIAAIIENYGFELLKKYL